MKTMHCENDRSEQQRITYETKDGRFKYQLLMDYAKGLPEEYEFIPYDGNVSGGCCDKDDNLYVGLRGGGFMTKEPRTCLIKLDPDGNYIESLGQGVLGELHFFNITDHDTITLVQTSGNYAIEMTMDGKEVVRTFGQKDKPCDNGKDKNLYSRLLGHNGIFATEPFNGHEGGTYAQYLMHQSVRLGEPFHNPTDVDFDSKGNYYFSDGYSNVAVHKFDKDGQYVKSWGGPGVFDPFTDTPGKFLVVHALCVDSSDNVWVCDREKDALHVFDSDGNVIAYYSHNLGQPSGVDTDGQYVYVVGRGGYLTIFDLEFNIVGQLGFFNGDLRAHDIAADSKGNLYLFPTRANFEHQIIALKRI